MSEEWRELYPQSVIDEVDAVHEKYSAMNKYGSCRECPDCGKWVNDNHWCAKYRTWTNADKICLDDWNAEMKEHNDVIDAYLHPGKPVQLAFEI